MYSCETGLGSIPLEVLTHVSNIRSQNVLYLTFVYYVAYVIALFCDRWISH